MKLAALFSGGKDSTYAIYYALSQAWQVPIILTLKPESEESKLWHYPAIKWTKLQAEAMEIRNMEIEVKSENEIEELKKALKTIVRKEGIEGLLSGVIASDYQKNKLDKICEELNLKMIAPLWQKNPLRILREVINAGFKVIIVSVAAYGFSKEWLGSEINEDTVKKLKKLNEKYSIHPCGEGGEFETFVLDAPIFKKKIEIIKSKIIWNRYSGQYIIEEAALRRK